MTEAALAIAKAAFSTEAATLEKTAAAMDWEAFARAVKVLRDTPRIGASGCGHTGIAMQHFAHLMCCIERPARFISPAEAVHGATGFLQKGDVLMLASRGGKTSELLPILDIARGKGVTVITLTENLSSTLAVGADIVLPIAVTRETDKYNSQGTSSFAAMNAVCDALQAALIEETHFEIGRFAVIHPGGAVGERLNRSDGEPSGR